jgi:hypothetical protein
LTHRDCRPGSGCKIPEFRITPGHLHHDTVAAFVIIRSGFHHFGRHHHVGNCFRIIPKNCERSITTIMPEARYWRRRARAKRCGRPGGDSLLRAKVPRSSNNDEATGGRFHIVCVIKGKKVETEEISAFSAVAFAGLGSLPDNMLSRSVIIKMKRRASHQHIEPYRQRIHSAEGQALGTRIAQWAEKATE